MAKQTNVFNLSAEQKNVVRWFALGLATVLFLFLTAAIFIPSTAGIVALKGYFFPTKSNTFFAPAPVTGSGKNQQASRSISPAVSQPPIIRQTGLVNLTKINIGGKKESVVTHRKVCDKKRTETPKAQFQQSADVEVPPHTVDVYNGSGGYVMVFRLNPDRMEIASSGEEGLVTKVAARDRTLGMWLEFKVSGKSGYYSRPYNFVHNKSRTHYVVNVGTRDIAVSED